MVAERHVWPMATHQTAPAPCLTMASSISAGREHAKKRARRIALPSCPRHLSILEVDISRRNAAGETEKAMDIYADGEYVCCTPLRLRARKHCG
jgi:hypothetical protein